LEREFPYRSGVETPSLPRKTARKTALARLTSPGEHEALATIVARRDLANPCTRLMRLADNLELLLDTPSTPALGACARMGKELRGEPALLRKFRPGATGDNLCALRDIGIPNVLAIYAR
jgi:hypothetical protein